MTAESTQLLSAPLAGVVVVVLIDYNPDPDLDWHYVVIYQKQGDDYLILDPWPLNEPNGVSLRQRFGHDRTIALSLARDTFTPTASRCSVR